MSQMEMVDLDSLLPSTHLYRGFQAYLPDATKALADMSQLKGADGYGVERLFDCLLLQFMEDLSDQELARYLEGNQATKLFVGSHCPRPRPTTASSRACAPGLGRLGSPNSLPPCASNSKPPGS